jgi:S-adenosylmethionine hydrolase
MVSSSRKYAHDMSTSSTCDSVASVPPLVTLTTDFGDADGYVGAMKGVLARLAPEAVVVDLAHGVPRGDVAHAAWVLATAAREFPVGTIHVVVVDPGVGGPRAELAIAAGGQVFVGPDNGVLAYVAVDHDGAYAIRSTAFRSPTAAPTFHGRDVFAPAAAALARGLPIHLAGPATCPAGALPWPAAAAGGQGVIVHVDRWGNLISNLAGPARGVAIAGHELVLATTYVDVAPGALVAYRGSAGTIEVAVRDGSAADRLGLARGAAIAVAP